MSTVITGTAGASVAASCTGPSAGDAVTAASVNGPLQSVENDIATLDSLKAPKASPTFTGIVKAPEYQFSSPVGITRTGYSTPAKQSGSWGVDSTTGYWTDASTGGVLRIPVDVPSGAVLQTVKIWIHPAGSHGGVPTVSFLLTKRVVATDTNSTPTQTGGSETSASVAAYETVHALTLTLTGGHTVNRAAAVYHLVLTGEGGGFALAGLQLVGVEYGYTMTEVGQD